MIIIHNSLINNNCTTNYYKYIISLLHCINIPSNKIINIDYNNFKETTINIHIILRKLL